MSEVITVVMSGEKDDAGTFSIFLWNSSSGLLLNTGGDILTRVENPSGTATPLRQFTLAETRTTDLIAVIYSGSTAIDSAALYDSYLPLSKTQVGEAYQPLVAALNNISSAQVNTEVLNVLNVQTFAELSAPPAATSSLKDKITWMFMWFRNKSTETATQRKLYANNTTTVVSTESVSDDGTTFVKDGAS